MRLREVYSVSKSIYRGVYEDFKIARTKCANVRSKMDNIILTEEIKTEINLIKLRIENIKMVLKSYEKNEVFDSVILERDTLEEIFRSYESIEQIERVISKIEKLVLEIKMVLRLCESIGVKENEIGLDIKMPKTDNITDFKKYIDDLEFVFTKSPFFYSEKESLKLNGTDIGSIWLVIGVAGASITVGSVILNNIAAFIDKCYIIKSHKWTCEKQKAEIEKAKVDQKQKEEMTKMIEMVYQVSVDNAVRELEETTKIAIKDNDERDRVNQCFDKLEKLLDKGLQIYAAIDSSEEVKAVFAPIEMHYLPKKDNITKIEDKSSDEE